MRRLPTSFLLSISVLIALVSIAPASAAELEKPGPEKPKLEKPAPGTAKPAGAKSQSADPEYAAEPVTATVKKRTIRTDVPLAVQARQTADRSIPYIEKEGTTWITNRKCLSCHHAGYMLWSFHDAARRGFSIDQEKLTKSTNWALEQTKGHGAEGAAQILLARDRSNTSETTAKQVDTLRDFVLSEQDKEGFWKAGGQLPDQKRPKPETIQVSTMLSVLGLSTLESKDKVLTDKLAESRTRALAWLRKTPLDGGKPAVSGEWYTLRLVIEKRFGDAKEVERLRDQILKAQKPDGGWGWLWADASDAFGTGLALYALSEAGVPSTHAAIEGAWRFLIETQADDGSWIVNGTKNSSKNKPHSMSSLWGSTWALLGLTKTLPDSAFQTAAAERK
jgi:hypothetical protein